MLAKHLNKDHPLYDFDMEVLALLPPEQMRGGKGYHAKLQDIAYDLGEKNQKPVLAAILRMAHAFGTDTHYVENWHCVRIKQTSWPKAKLAAERYLNDVYGDEG